MTPYADPDDLVTAADLYDVPPPPLPVRVGLIDLACRDVSRHLGTTWDPDTLTSEQAVALRIATVAQALFRWGQGGDAALGLDDGLAGVGELRFSLRPTARLSPEAAELLAGHRLFTRSSTVLPNAEG